VGALGDVSGSPVVAYVNHGRWVADCPICNGAELVTPGDPYICQNCLNGARQYRPVSFPPDIEEIEAALVARPLPLNRNWTTETAAMLRAENVSHGVGD
jgi:hypothetical protein